MGARGWALRRAGEKARRRGGRVCAHGSLAALGWERKGKGGEGAGGAAVQWKATARPAGEQGAANMGLMGQMLG